MYNGHKLVINIDPPPKKPVRPKITPANSPFPEPLPSPEELMKFLNAMSISDDLDDLDLDRFSMENHINLITVYLCLLLTI